MQISPVDREIFTLPAGTWEVRTRVGDAVVDGGLAGEDEVAVGVVADLVGGAAGVAGEDLLEQGPDAGDLVGLDDQVGDGALLRMAGWCSTTRACGSIWRRPGSPPASSTAAVQAAWPTQVVSTGEATNCIAS